MLDQIRTIHKRVKALWKSAYAHGAERAGRHVRQAPRRAAHAARRRAGQEHAHVPRDHAQQRGPAGRAERVATPLHARDESRAARARSRLGADITCVPTREGWLYLAVILDLASRRVAGWALRTFEFIEIWYNRQRRHSTLGYRTPVEYEATLAQTS